MTQQGIFGFFGPYRFLSNFHFVDVELDGVVYRTTEHAYQAAKTIDPEIRERFQRLTAPRDARRLGQQIEIRPDWESVKYEVMYDLNLQKFSKGPLLWDLLMTGDSYLEETNTWGDQYWGVCNGKGQNNLGKILMAIRSELRWAQEADLIDGMGR